MKMMKHRVAILLTVCCTAVMTLVSCYSEDALVPTQLNDEPLFDFPQGNSESDRTLQQIQERFGCYAVYRGITPKLLNRAWVNLYPTMTLVADEISDAELPFYVDFLSEHLLSCFDADTFGAFLPRYFFLVKNLHREDNGIAKTHMPIKTDGVDFWAVSFESRFLENPVVSELRRPRLQLAYELILRALDAGLIEIPLNFSEGIDYETPICNDFSNPHSENHFQTRGFVAYVQPDFSVETKSYTVEIAAAKNQDFLMYVRKMLYSTPEVFEAENGSYDLVMKRYRIVLNCLKTYGVDLSAIASGPQPNK